MSRALEVRDLKVGYGEIVAVRDVSLDVAEGEIVALIGPNGAGKTTLVSAIARLLPVRHGTITFFGRDVTRLKGHRLAEEAITLVPQGRQLFPSMSVIDNLRLGSFARRARAGADTRLEEVLDRFPVLRKRAQQDAGSLSGGEQQMLTIGRALMTGPRFMMLDEPSLGLAPIGVAIVAEIIEQIRAEGVTVLLVEQNIPVAFDLADRVYLLDTGEVIDSGTPDELRARTSVEAAYLGVS